MNLNLILFAMTSLVLGSGVGFLLGRFTSGAILYLLWAALAGGLLVLLIAPLGAVFGLAQDEWSRMLYTYISVIFMGPALVGSGVFGWIGLRIRRSLRDERRRDG